LPLILFSNLYIVISIIIWMMLKIWWLCWSSLGNMKFWSSHPVGFSLRNQFPMILPLQGPIVRLAFLQPLALQSHPWYSVAEMATGDDQNDTDTKRMTHMLTYVFKFKTKNQYAHSQRFKGQNVNWNSWWRM